MGFVQDKQIDVRPFVSDEWALCRTIRLEALREEPFVFGSTYAAEETRDEAYWRATAASDDCCVFGAFDGEAVIGCVGLATMRDDLSGESAILWGTYVQKMFRGKGIAGLLYKVLITHALQRPQWKRIVV